MPAEDTTSQMDSAAARPPTVKKNALSKPTKPPAKFRKRQVNKSWLPTHVWHAKRCHMTDPLDPLWRFAIAQTPTEKCFRPTHRATGMKGCVAFDSSYMGTIAAEGVELSLLGLLRSSGVHEDLLTGKSGAKWRTGTRSWTGWMRERDGDQAEIAPFTVIWCSTGQHITTLNEEAQDASEQKKKAKRKLFLRVHPSAFFAVWKESLKNAKTQKPQVMLEDLRFEIGSIEITGPASTEALVGILHPTCGKDVQSTGSVNTAEQVPSHESVEQPAATATASPNSTMPSPGAQSSERVFIKLAAVTNPSSLPENAVLTFEVNDPRLYHPPRTILDETPSESDLLSILSEWPPDRDALSGALFDQKARLSASKLPSQKAINRRKGDTGLGSYPSLLPSDPRIPVMLLTSRPAPAGDRRSAIQGSWTLILPRSCVLPVWYSLVHYPSSTGGTPRFGGLQETMQISFQHETAWFPGDFPGTSAGWAWEVREREKAKREWERRPKGKRCEWSSLDLGEGRKGEIGIGWGCDWERLFTEQLASQANQPTNPAKDDNTTLRSESKKNDQKTSITPARPDEQMQPIETDSPSPAPPLSICHLRSPFPSTVSQTALTTVHITLLHSGRVARNARIYRLPSSSASLRSRWLDLLPTDHSRLLSTLNATPNQRKQHHVHKTTTTTKKAMPSINLNTDPETRMAAASKLARLLIDSASAEAVNPSHAQYPSVPGEEDLIGFVTSANYALSSGRCAAIGNIAPARVLPCPAAPAAAPVPSSVLMPSSGFKASAAEGNTDSSNSHQKEFGDRDGDGERKGIGKHGHICIVRNAGQSTGWLGRWKFI